MTKTGGSMGIRATVALFGLFGFAACGASPASSGFTPGGAMDASSGKPGPASSTSPNPEGGNPGLGAGFADAGASDAPIATAEPTTCAEAAASYSYLGCDYWPTPLTNPVWSIFDFAVVVSNGQSVSADVTVTGPAGFSQQVTVPSNQLSKIYLPWNTALKGPDWDPCTEPPNWDQSVASSGGAFHLVSSVPVTVYQFNALEYGPQGGPSGKDWSSCVGAVQTCDDPGDPDDGAPLGCNSYSNDASLLLPSTAMTGTYRVMGIDTGSTSLSFGTTTGTYFAVTGTQDGTTVTVTLSQTATVAAGGSVQAAAAGGTLTFMVNAGDVVEVTSPGASATEDLSGSLVKASQPVQVIAGHPCQYMPVNTTNENASCDHLEASVFPAETLGKHYVVNAPTGPHGSAVAQIVRIYGNVDGTTLTYEPSAPPGCPTTIGAGQVVDCGTVETAFEVTGSSEFGVGLFMQSAVFADPNDPPANQLGDPSMSFAVAVEQFRSKYIFLAPSDYVTNFADVIVAPGTTLTLDGAPVTVAPESIDANFSVVRVELTVGSTNGAHVMEANDPFGIQVLGYAPYTSYQYPGGLNLQPIAPPPAQ